MDIKITHLIKMIVKELETLGYSQLKDLYLFVVSLNNEKKREEEAKEER